MGWHPRSNRPPDRVQQIKQMQAMPPLCVMTTNATASSAFTREQVDEAMCHLMNNKADDVSDTVVVAISVDVNACTSWRGIEILGIEKSNVDFETVTVFLRPIPIGLCKLTGEKQLIDQLGASAYVLVVTGTVALELFGVAFDYGVAELVSGAGQILGRRYLFNLIYDPIDQVMGKVAASLQRQMCYIACVLRVKLAWFDFVHGFRRVLSFNLLYVVNLLTDYLRAA
ncbi:hypothetical protein K456DRAFT_39713 [Colletotrichum gloeosporioides 23]|nr:hypothetical protein K456DRAFT_39713 [Colletotrichum gloeosporioides 23]